jgi:hypothetical protein
MIGELREGQWHFVSFSTDGTRWSATLDRTNQQSSSLLYTDVSELVPTLVIRDSESRPGATIADITIDDLRIYEAPLHFATVFNLLDPRTAYDAHTLISRLDRWIPFDGNLAEETQRCARPLPAHVLRMPTTGTVPVAQDERQRSTAHHAR